MHVTEKQKPLTAAKYFNAYNVDRYRSIMRIFYKNYKSENTGYSRKHQEGIFGENV